MAFELDSRSLRRVWLRADVLAASFGINVLALALPIGILQTYDRVIRNRAVDTLIVLALIMLASFALEFLLRVMRASIMSKEAARYDHRASCGLFARLLNIDVNTFKTESSGVHADRFQAVQAVRAYYCQAATLAADLPFIAVFIALIAVIAGWMAIVPLFLLLVFGLLGFLFTRRLMVETDRREKTDIKHHNFLVECIGAIATVKAMGAEGLMQRRHERLAEEAADAFGAMARVNEQSQTVATELAQAASIVIVVIGAFAVVGGALTIGGLSATTLLTGRLLQPILKGLGLLSRYPSIRIAEDKLRRLAEFSLQTEGSHPVPKRPRIGLCLEGVSFRYPNCDVNAIDRIDLSVSPGKYIAITGATSSGRSTLLKLMNGLLNPSEGSVRYENVPLMVYSKRHLRRHIALMPNAPTIYAGTLLENLTSFEDGPVKRRALALCRVLGLTEYIAGLNRGLETRLTGAGDTPMGIAQRISIARVLAQNPRVILFDNANVALDHEADRQLLKFFTHQKGRRTAIFVTDRPSYLKICDHVYELTDGKLRERGREQVFARREAG